MTEIPKDYVKVLDKGYVGLVDVLGTDLTPANAARTSFAKSADQFEEEQNVRLVNYLLRNKEYSTLRHNALTFEIRMPLMVARQMWKYIVGSNWTEDQLGWNENSRRYITDGNEFYIPVMNEWRSAPDNKKQGSGVPVDDTEGAFWTDCLEKFAEAGESLYQSAIDSGIAPELARLFLPAYGLYVTCYWTASLNSILHVLAERLEHDAQKEIQDYAKVIRDFTEQAFPNTFAAWEKS